MDAAAAGAAASMSSLDDDSLEGIRKDPVQIVQDLIEITLKTQLVKLVKKTQRIRRVITEDQLLPAFRKWILKKVGFNKKKEIPKSSVEW